MGRRGPQPQPNDLKKLRGNPGKRPIKEIPLAKVGIPVCPDELSHLKPTWDYYGLILERIGILRETDAIAYETMFRTFDKYMQITKAAKPGRIRTEDGRMLTDPHMAMELQYLNALMRLLDRFGMSPSARNSLSIEAPKDEDEFTRFLNARKQING